MKPFTLRDALNAVNGRYFGNEAALDSDIDRVTSDSRTAGTGALFIALKGTRVDGHDFMHEFEQTPGDGEGQGGLVSCSP